MPHSLSRYGARDTPIFRNDALSRRDPSEYGDGVSATFSAWDKRNSATFMTTPMVRPSMHGGPSPKSRDPNAKSEVSVISMDGICDFEDYVPFKPSYDLEQIDEEKAVGLDDLEEQKSQGVHYIIRKIPDLSLKEARMSEEESYDSKRLSSASSDSDEEDNDSEYRDHLKVEANLKPRKSSTFNSSQLNDRTLRFPSKLSTLYRQGTGNSDMTLGNNSQKGVMLTSICTSKDGTKSEALINPVSLRQKIKK